MCLPPTGLNITTLNKAAVDMLHIATSSRKLSTLVRLWLFICVLELVMAVAESAAGQIVVPLLGGVCTIVWFCHRSSDMEALVAGVPKDICSGGMTSILTESS